MRSTIRQLDRRIRELKREVIDDEPAIIITVCPPLSKLSRADLGPNERIVEDFLCLREGRSKVYRKRERATADESDHGRFLDADSGVQIGFVGPDGAWLGLDGESLHRAPALVIVQPEGVEKLREEVRRRGQGPSSGGSLRPAARA